MLASIQFSPTTQYFALIDLNLKLKFCGSKASFALLLILLGQSPGVGQWSQHRVETNVTAAH